MLLLLLLLTDLDCGACDLLLAGLLALDALGLRLLAALERAWLRSLDAC